MMTFPDLGQPLPSALGWFVLAWFFLAFLVAGVFCAARNYDKGAGRRG